MDVSRETRDLLGVFVDLFLHWSRSINLVAGSTTADLWKRHIVDSAQIFQLAPQPGIWVDLGSGGGFPGIITAILLKERNDGWVHLVESNNKKAAFLRAALIKTGARGTVHACRIEDAWGEIAQADFISSRALADLDRLYDFIWPWAERNPNLRSYLHKGRDYRREIAFSHRRWNADLVEHISIVEPDSVILEIRGLKPTASLPGAS